MMMTCGHVIAKDSLTKLSKTGGWVRTVYLLHLLMYLVLEDVSSVHIARPSLKLRQR